MHSEKWKVVSFVINGGSEKVIICWNIFLFLQILEVNFEIFH